MSKKWLDDVFGTIFQCSTSTKSLKGGEWGQRKSDIWQHPKFHWTVGFVENYSEPRSILNDARTVGIIVSEILAIAVNHQWEREKDFLLRLISSCLVDMNGENFFSSNIWWILITRLWGRGIFSLTFLLNFLTCEFRETKREIEKLIH